MNRHSYGRKYGVSVSALNKETYWTLDRSTSKVEQTKAKIFDNELFIRTEYRLFT